MKFIELYESWNKESFILLPVFAKLSLTYPWPFWTLTWSYKKRHMFRFNFVIVLFRRPSDWPCSTETAMLWTTWASPSSTTSCRVSCTSTPPDRDDDRERGRGLSTATIINMKISPTPHKNTQTTFSVICRTCTPLSSRSIGPSFCLCHVTLPLWRRWVLTLLSVCINVWRCMTQPGMLSGALLHQVTLSSNGPHARSTKWFVVEVVARLSDSIKLSLQIFFQNNLIWSLNESKWTWAKENNQLKLIVTTLFVTLLIFCSLFANSWTFVHANPKDSHEQTKRNASFQMLHLKHHQTTVLCHHELTYTIANQCVLLLTKVSLDAAAWNGFWQMSPPA